MPTDRIIRCANRQDLTDVRHHSKTTRMTKHGSKKKLHQQAKGVATFIFRFHFFNRRRDNVASLTRGEHCCAGVFRNDLANFQKPKHRLMNRNEQASSSAANGWKQIRRYSICQWLTMREKAWKHRAANRPHHFKAPGRKEFYCFKKKLILLLNLTSIQILKNKQDKVC